MLQNSLDARVYQLLLQPRGSASLDNPHRRRFYVHVIDGELQLEGEILKQGDGAQLKQADVLRPVPAEMRLKALVFDLPGLQG